MSKHPPLWIWLVSLGLIIALIIYLQLTTSVRRQVLRDKQYSVFMQQMGNFVSEYQPDSSQCKVICWGTSMSSQAIENSIEMHNRITTYDQDIDVQKVYMLGANAKTFPYIYEFFEVTKQLKPDLICIEDNLFSHTSQNLQHHKLIKEFNHLLTAWSNETSAIKEPSRFRNKTFDTYNERFDISQGKDTLMAPDLYPRTALSFSDNKVLNQQLQFILKQQIPIVIFNIPRAGEVQNFLLTPKVQKAIDKQIEEYRLAGFLIEYWEFPAYFPYKYYRDYMHMNQAGRTIYSEWLSEKIAKKLADQCH